MKNPLFRTHEPSDYITFGLESSHSTGVRGREWALKRAQENKLEVANMRMLRWMCGVTKLDKIRNEIIREETKVGEITIE